MKRKLLLLLLIVTTWSYGQYTAIPDPNFEQALIDLGYDSEGGPIDGQILTADISIISQLQLTSYNITNFQGLEAISNLTAFTLTNNQSVTIQEIDFSANLLLEEITIINVPNLPSVNISQNNAITNLTIVTRGSLFSTINLSGKSSMTSLQLADNQITDIDLSGVPNLVNLSLAINPLTNVDVKSLSALETLDTYESQITTLDLSQNTNLTRLNSDNGSLTFVNLRNGANNLLTSVELNGNSNLTCIQVDDVTYSEQQTLLGNWSKDAATTYSENCGFTFIPDTNFELALIAQGIDSEGGPPNGLILTSDISGRLSLDISGQGINDLSGLEDFSSLEILNVSDNNLDELRLQNLSLVDIRANNCNLGGKPIRFQNAPPNGAFLTNVTTLELQNNGIGSPGSTISFGGVPNVTYLDISDNNFGTIQLNESTSIETLLANNCPNLTTLANLGSLNNLESLGASFSGLSELDISQNGQLAFLNISGNTLTSLDLSNNNVIGSVYAGNNDLSTISLPTTTTLTELYVENNIFSALDLSTADQNLFDFDATGNTNLTCIQVSNLDFAQRAWSIDTGTSYSTNCNPQPFTVTASIPGSAGNPSAIEITEGNSFALNFESGPTAPDGTQYTPIVVFTSNNNNSPTDDFTYNGNASLPTAPFTVSSANPDGGITILAINDGVTEGNETYTISISSPDPSLFTIEGPTSFEVTVKDVSTEYSGEPFTLSATLAGDVQNNTINEGGTIEIWIEANLPNEAEGFDFNFNYEVQGIGGLTNEDYEIISNNPYNFQINNGVNGNPDGRLEIVILTDSYFDPNEKIRIVLEPINNFYVDWENGDFSDGERGQIEFEIEINNISTTTNSISGILGNTGGTEGNGVEGGLGSDTFTLTLKNSDGTDYIAEENLVFDIIFSEDESVPENSRAIRGIDYLVPTPAQIRINATESSGSISVQLPQETETDDQHEFYLVTVENPGPSINIDLPQPLQAKIIDDEGKFTVYYSIEEGNLTLEAENGNSCCNYYGVEEGELIRYRFMHEKGVVSNYEVKLNYGGGNDPLILDNMTISSATKGRNNPVSERNDFYSTAETEFETDENDIEFEKFTVTTPIYDFRIKVNSLDEKGEAPERFSASFSEYSSNFSLELAEDTHDTDFDFLIEEAIPASIVANDKEASENPLENAQFTVTLDELNTGNNLTVYYEVDFNNSSSENDIEELSGSVVIPNNQQSATINVVPVNDPDFELEETLIIRLLDGPRYSVNETSAQDIISILSEDEANYTATMRSGEDNTSSELLEDDYAEVIIELNEPPTNDNIEVFFKISDQTNQSVVIEGEGEDYLIYQADKSTIIPSDNRKVVFEANGGTRKSIFVKALLDGLDENNESLFLELDNGVNYRLGIPNGAEVILQSATTDLTSFDPNTISVVSKKPRCPGDDQEGFIEISNASGFEFDIVIYDNTEDEVDRFLLGTNSSADRIKNSKPLTIGRYEIILEFKGEKPENAIAPRYVVQIEKLDDMTVEEQGVDLKSKTGSFIVSGSQSYTLRSQIGEYHFNFDDTNEHLITLPLETGLNSIEIQGDAICLGTVKKEILLKDIYIFPNPSYEIVSLMGESLKEFKGLVLFDMQGKLVFEKTTADKGIDKMEINISSLQKGMYLGKILTGNNQTVEFKLIKR